MEQILIVVLTVVSTLLYQFNSKKLRRWACLIALASEPFWLHATWTAHQYGMFINTLVMTGIVIFGIYLAWFKKE